METMCMKCQNLFLGKYHKFVICWISLESGKGLIEIVQIWGLVQYGIKIKALNKIVAGNFLNFFSLFFNENKTRQTIHM